MRFRLVIHDTDNDNKYYSESRYEFFGDKESIFFLWHTLVNVEHKKHVEIFNLMGVHCHPRLGISGMYDYFI